MNLQQLTTFSTVINEGSMTAAAEKLFLTQPAVSQQIRNLEEELGVELLVRGVRQAKATLQGQILYDYAKKIIALTQQAEVAIQTIGAEVEGHLRIGTINSLGLYMISPVVGLFLKHNSNLKITLTYARGEDVMKRFRDGELDVAILPDCEKEYGHELDGARKQLLAKDELWLVASGKDPHLPSSIDFSELVKKPLVSMTANYPYFEAQLKKKFAEHSMRYSPVFEATNVGTLKRVVESGLGWGFLPSHSIYKQVRMGRLHQIEVENFRYPINVFYYSRKESESQTVDVFYRALQQQASSKR